MNRVFNGISELAGVVRTGKTDEIL